MFTHTFLYFKICTETYNMDVLSYLLIHIYIYTHLGLKFGIQHQKQKETVIISNEVNALVTLYFKVSLLHVTYTCYYNNNKLCIITCK